MSEAVSIQIGTRTFNEPDDCRSDAQCDSSRNQVQEFSFDSQSSPMRSGTNTVSA